MKTSRKTILFPVIAFLVIFAIVVIPVQAHSNTVWIYWGGNSENANAVYNSKTPIASYTPYPYNPVTTNPAIVSDLQPVTVRLFVDWWMLERLGNGGTPYSDGEIEGMLRLTNEYQKTKNAIITLHNLHYNSGVILSFYGTPDWARASDLTWANGQSARIADNYINYFGNTIVHFDKALTQDLGYQSWVFEIWNEPDVVGGVDGYLGGWATADTEQAMREAGAYYGKVVQAVYSQFVIHGIPTYLVVGAAMMTGPYHAYYDRKPVSQNVSHKFWDGFLGYNPAPYRWNEIIFYVTAHHYDWFCWSDYPNNYYPQTANCGTPYWSVDTDSAWDIDSQYHLLRGKLDSYGLANKGITFSEVGLLCRHRDDNGILRDDCDENADILIPGQPSIKANFWNEQVYYMGALTNWAKSHGPYYSSGVRQMLWYNIFYHGWHDSDLIGPGPGFVKKPVYYLFQCMSIDSTYSCVVPIYPY